MQLSEKARIAVIAVGGGAGSAMNTGMPGQLEGVRIISVDTDAGSLAHCTTDLQVNIGRTLTRGSGSGGNLTLGRAAAEESRLELATLIKEMNLVFVTAALGGGTGTGSAPVIAHLAKATGAFTIGVVSRPFRWEGKVRNEIAEQGIDKLRDQVDAMIVITNDQLSQVVDQKATLEEAFKIADDVLRQGSLGIAELIVSPGVISLDFIDVKAMMSGTVARMGIGLGAGESRAEHAAQEAVSSPLLEASIGRVRAILFTVAGTSDLTLRDIQKAFRIVKASADRNANIIFGVVRDENMQDEVRITILAIDSA
jgi:cell division protein FtsZ